MFTEVFVSYAREDEAIANLFVKRLEREGLIIWWDQRVAPKAENFRRQIEERLNDARCVLVLWTENSSQSEWVINEAEKAKNNGTLLQVCIGIDRDSLPMPFGALQLKHTFSLDGEIDDKSLDVVVEAINVMIGVVGPNEHVITPYIPFSKVDLDNYWTGSFVPGTDTLLSFRPTGRDGVFFIMRFETTDGWVPDYVDTAKERHRKYNELLSSGARKQGSKTDIKYEHDGDTFLKVCNDIYIIKDPLRPFSIQIGGLRSKRPHKDPGIISGNITTDHVDTLPLHFEWLSMTLAEIVSNEETLNKLSNAITELRDFKPKTKDENSLKQKKQKLYSLIGRNPNSPKDIQKDTCRFCSKVFKKKHSLSSTDKETKYGAFITSNDYPFGPFFHYLAITDEPVHFWEDMEYRHMEGLNLIAHEFLQEKKNLNGAFGVGFGFNSTVRHLVLGSHTSSSAGASIPHIHKQIWGLAAGTSNLAEQLITVSQAYWNHNIDYQDSYIKALESSGYIIWPGSHVVLYIPYGQSSLYELQAMIRKPCGSYSDLSTEQVVELSKAEYIALRLFKALGITSFNHVILSKLFNDNRAPQFRLVECFITREVDLAVSELSMLYVVDQHPWTSRNIIIGIWEELKSEILDAIKDSEIETGVGPRQHIDL